MEWTYPKTFEEYINRYPVWHKYWLRKAYPSQCLDEDLQQFLMVRSITTKRVEKYDPKRRGGIDNEKMFFDWMGRCFDYDVKFFHRRQKTQKRIAPKDTVSLNDYLHPENDANNSPNSSEILGFVSGAYARKSVREGTKVENAARVKEFREFLEKHRPDLIPLMEAAMEGNDLNHKLGSLRILVRHMENGTTPPKSRAAELMRIAQKKLPRKERQRLHKFGVDKLRELAARHATLKSAAIELGCSVTWIGIRCRELTGAGWVTLKRSMRAKAAAK